MITDSSKNSLLCPTSYSEMSKMANEDPQFKKIWDEHSPELLEIIEGRKKTLLGFEELISPILLRLKKLSGGE